MNLTVCGTCGQTVEAHPIPAAAMATLLLPQRGIPAVVLLSTEPDDLGDVWVTPHGVEFPRDPDALRLEGVPLRRNHQDVCKPPPMAKRKRVWTKKGWRTR